MFLNFVPNGANVVARNDSTNDPVYEVYKGGLTANDRTVRINSDGSSAFSGQLNLGANMQFTAADPELEFNNGGPRFKVPAANTLSIHTGGGLGTTTSERLRITPDGDCLPGDDATQDLGSASARWANIYSADLQLSNEGAANDVDGTWGQYTIQEGENDLYLLNRRNGKTYKFVLQEVQ